MQLSQSQLKAFKEKLLHPTSKHLYTKLTQYLPLSLFSALDAATCRDDMSLMVQEFIRGFEATARNYECWRGVSAEELELNSEALESLIAREKYK